MKISKHTSCPDKNSYSHSINPTWSQPFTIHVHLCTDLYRYIGIVFWNGCMNVMEVIVSFAVWLTWDKALKYYFWVYNNGADEFTDNTRLESAVHWLMIQIISVWWQSKYFYLQEELLSFSARRLLRVKLCQSAQTEPSHPAHCCSLTLSTCPQTCRIHARE